MEQRQFCRKGIHTCIPAVTLTFDGGGRLHWCAEHADDAERYRNQSAQLETQSRAIVTTLNDPYEDANRLAWANIFSPVES